MKQADKTGKYCLACALLRAFIPEFIYLSLPRIALVGFTVAQPFLVQRTLSYVSAEESEETSDGYGLLGAYALVFGGFAVRLLPICLSQTNVPDFEWSIWILHIQTGHHVARRFGFDDILRGTVIENELH